jgi:acyl-coenzyme A thioesterase PaaI-like protein
VFRRTGGRITYIANDLRRVQIKLPLNWKTKNYVGTIFGGSMYSVVDPIYMVMFIKLFGPDYTVWDKSAIIHYKKPGRSTLTAEFSINEKELNAIRQALRKQAGIDRIYQVELSDEANKVYAVVEKTIYFKKKKRNVADKNLL